MRRSPCSNILDRANIGRSTFYTHFQDKEELLLSGVHELQAMLTTAQKLRTSSATPHENIIAFSRAMFDHAHGYRKVYHALVAAQVWPRLRQPIQDVLAGLIRSECRADVKRLQRSKPEVPIELFIHYVAATFMAVLTWWIDHKSSLSPEEIDRVFRFLVIPTARSVLT